MERNLNHDEFDHFLKESADGLRMHPSDRVWKGIAKELDHQKRRFGTFFALFLFILSGTYVTWEIAHAPAQRQVAQHASVIQTPPSFDAPVQQAPKVVAGRPSTQFQQALPSRAANNFLPTIQAKQSTASQENTANLNTLVETGPLVMSTISADIIPEATADTLTQMPERNPSAVSVISSGIQPIRPELADAASKSGNTNHPVRIKARTRKLSWQIFATPTVSYRKLSDNKGYVRPILTTGIPANFSALYGINEAVIHKPDLGIEFGVAARIPIRHNLRLRTGFQFNVSRYDIKAFSYVPEVATFALNNGPRVDSVRAISNYRNFSGGGGSNWLQNFYFQASMPVGLELKVASNKRMHWGIASSVQPTYVIGNRSYMITADYKNYARVPWLTRRWNLNTSLETFMSFNSGKTQWQVGPQVRYQALSSFISEYPVKENLFDFGMKVGITLQ